MDSNKDIPLDLNFDYGKKERNVEDRKSESKNISARGQYTFEGDLGSITPSVNYSSGKSKLSFKDGFVVDQEGKQIGYSVDGELLLNKEGTARLRAGIGQDKTKSKVKGTYKGRPVFQEKMNDQVTKFRFGGGYKDFDADVEATDEGDFSGRAIYRLDESGDISLQGAVDREGNVIGQANLKLRFNEGGLVPMEKQMEMFQDGGLADQGGTEDPISGNSVPTGSLQEEVRDDIPAQLSEGEYVVPADVVRFYGIRFFEELRMKAKEGYGLLEAKGQMGNGDEQVIPDDVPFDMEDLEFGSTEQVSEEDNIVKMVKERIGGDSLKFKGQTYTAEQIASRLREDM